MSKVTAQQSYACAVPRHSINNRDDPSGITKHDPNPHPKLTQLFHKAAHPKLTSIFPRWVVAMPVFQASDCSIGNEGQLLGDLKLGVAQKVSNAAFHFEEETKPRAWCSVLPQVRRDDGLLNC